LEAERQKEIKEKGYSDIIYFTYSAEHAGIDIQNKMNDIMSVQAVLSAREELRRDGFKDYAQSAFAA